ncbi:MAG TPA: alpha/beta hydrolase [Allosphingosinicella sp.]|nr:alpha/beta hydrolase [Allosphingosinicella sp.]
MRISRRDALAGTLAAALAGRAAARTPPPSTAESRHLVLPDPTETIDLWPGRPPGAPAMPPVESVHERSRDPDVNDRYIVGIARPRLVLFRPARPSGAAMLIAPGGGFDRVVIDKEGYEMARWLAGRGVTAFVLFYRLPQEGWTARPDTPLQDAQRAMRLIRAGAAGFGVDPKRLCAMGFSAGGYVCADLLARFAAPVYAPVDGADRLGARPDGAAPIYPVVSMSLPIAHAGSRRNLLGETATPAMERAHSPNLNIAADAPPSFLLHAEDDPAVPVANTLLLREALLARKVPVETHLFAEGGHGFGLRLSRGHSVEGWQEIFWAWGSKRKLFG